MNSIETESIETESSDNMSLNTISNFDDDISNSNQVEDFLNGKHKRTTTNAEKQKGVSTLMSLLDGKDNEFDEQATLKDIKIYVPRIILEEYEPTTLQDNTIIEEIKNYSNEENSPICPLRFHENVLEAILEFQSYCINLQVEKWSHSFFLRSDEPLISSVKRFYDCELPPWHRLVAYICKDVDFEKYSRSKRFEFCSERLAKNKNNRDSLLSFYVEVSQEMCERDGFLVMRAKLEEVVIYHKLGVPSAEMLASVKSMKDIKLLIERTIPSYLNFSYDYY